MRRRAALVALGALRALRALGAATAALAAGCASTPVPGELPLTASGRMAIRVDAFAGRPAQSQSASFEWRGDGRRGELKVLSPLGTQLAQARWAPGEAWLVTAEGTARFDDLEALAERAFGERLPLQAWADWLAGRPWPGAASAALGNAQAAGFEQLGWRVDLSRHAEGRIEARRESPPAVTLRIVLDTEAGGRPPADVASPPCLTPTGGGPGRARPWGRA